MTLLEQTAPNGDSWSQWRSIPAHGPWATADPAFAVDTAQILQAWLRVPETTDLFRLWQRGPNSDEWVGGWVQPKPPLEADEPEQPSAPPH